MTTSLIRRLAEIGLGPIVLRRHLPSQAGAGVIVSSGKVGGLKYLLKSAKKWDPELLTVAEHLVRGGQGITGCVCQI